MNTTRHTILTALTLSGLTIAPAAHAQTPAYTFVDLGTLATRNESSGAASINDSGQITGASNLQAFNGITDNLAFLWSPTATDGSPASGGHMKSIGTVGGIRSSGAAINNQGQIVGTSNTTEGNRRNYDTAFLWTPGATDGVGTNPQMKDLGRTGGSTESTGQAINSLGQALVLSGTTFVATAPPGGPVVRADVPGSNHTSGYALNSAGDVVGSANGYQGFLYRNGTMTDLGSLGGGFTFAYGISDTGLIVGGSYTAAFAFHAFSATVAPDGTVTMTDLGALGGAYNQAGAQGVNNLGQIVGTASNQSSGAGHAFLWQNGAMTDLNSLIDPGLHWTLDSAAGINNLGQIVGSATYSFGGVTFQHGYVLNPNFAPTPEPSAGVGFVVGLLALGSLLLRARRAQKETIA